MGRFIPNDNTWAGFATTLTGTVDTPKVADVTGAVDLTHFLTSINAAGTGSAVPTPAFDTKFEESIDGTVQGTFTADFYRDDDDDLAWETLPRGTKGFFIIARYGGKPATVADKCEVWPVTVLSRAVPNETNNAPVTFTVTCSIPAEPGEDAAVVT
jgi:hypothetical protein